MTTRSDTPTRRTTDVDRDVTVERDVTVDRDVTYVEAADDRAIRWGPIVAGLVTALSTFILLSLLALGAGLAAASPGQDEAGAGTIATVVASIIALASFFLGGFIAAWSGRAFDPARGALYGFLVWATWLLVMLVLSGMGLGTLFGQFGTTLGNVQTPDMTPDQILDALSTGALGTFLALALAALAAMLGGIVGTNDSLYRRARR